MFTIGDIIYSKVQYAGCSYHYEFGIVEKITPNGRFRFRPISSKHNGAREVIKTTSGPHKGRVWAVEQPVQPDLDIKSNETFLLQKDGYRKGELSRCYYGYEKYSGEENLKNYSDFGD